MSWFCFVHTQIRLKYIRFICNIVHTYGYGSFNLVVIRFCVEVFLDQRMELEKEYILLVRSTQIISRKKRSRRPLALDDRSDYKCKFSSIRCQSLGINCVEVGGVMKNLLNSTSIVARVCHNKCKCQTERIIRFANKNLESHFRKYKFVPQVQEFKFKSLIHFSMFF